MRLRYRWPVLLACLVIVGVNGWLWLLPFARIGEGPPPRLGEHQVLLEPGAVLRQTLALSAPAPRDVSLRVWTQRIVPSERPFLRIRGESGGQTLGVATIPLAAADGAFHMRQSPWWRLPPEAQELTVVIEGQGMWIAAMAVDRVAGGDLEVNAVSQAPNDLALQVVSGDLGIERYLPLTRITNGKPGLLGWARYPLLLFSLYLVAVALLLRSPRQLLRWVEDSEEPRTENQEQRTKNKGTRG